MGVYGWYTGIWGVGKIIKENENYLQIKYSEGQLFIPEAWDPKGVKTFDSPVKAIAYHLVNQNTIKEPSSKQEVIISFLKNFPSQKKTLEKYLHAQTLPKRTGLGCGGYPIKGGSHSPFR